MKSLDLHVVGPPTGQVPASPGYLTRRKKKTFVRRASEWAKDQMLFLILGNTSTRSYSIQRLIAFEEYRQENPIRVWKILFFSLVTPFFPISLFLLINWIIPLDAPNVDWKLNYGFYIRKWVLIGGNTMAILVQLECYFPIWHLNKWEQFCCVFIMASINVLTTMAVAATKGFPPKGVLSNLSFIFTLFCGVLYTLFLRWKRRRRKQQQQQSRSLGPTVTAIPSQTSKQTTTTIKLTSEKEQNVQAQLVQMTIRILLFECGLLIIYPWLVSLYETMGLTTNGLQFVMSFLSLVWKSILSKIALYGLFHHAMDMAPESVVFIVNFFHAFFLSICMSSSSRNDWSLVLIIGIDIVHIGYSTIRILSQAKQLLNVFEQLYSLNNCQTKSNTPSSAGTKEDNNDDVFTSMVHFAKSNENKLKQRQDIRWTSSDLIRLKSMPSMKKMLSSARIQPPPPSVAASAARASSSSSFTTNKTTKVNTTQDKTTVTLSSSSSSSSSMDAPITTTSNHEDMMKTLVLQQLLRVLFEVEYLVLTEFVESMIPFSYALYLLGIDSSSSRAYLPATKDKTPEMMQDSLQRMCLYGLLELCTLLLFGMLVKWKLRLNIFTLLTFVLETHFTNIQAKLIFFLAYLLHYGAAHWA